MRLLPAGVEVLLAAGDVVGAREACQRFEGLAARFDTAALRALAAQARGTVEMAEGATEQALPRLRSAAEVWQRLGAPYMAARARVLIGAACRALGDADGAGLELAAARAAFERLGATSELRRLDAVAAPAPARPGGRRGLTARELEVLRAVATGLTNKEIGVRLLVSERTVDRHVSNIFAKVGVGTRSAATAWAYENDVV
jgi:DNA-binding CsgD family transcriptional regulator